ncbi:MAG: hypothetical protein QG622_1995 [Actinomycetota bacterium]|nr:hypothetical protein [Actinomycetota bacterium]
MIARRKLSGFPKLNPALLERPVRGRSGKCRSLFVVATLVVVVSGCSLGQSGGAVSNAGSGSGGGAVSSARSSGAGSAAEGESSAAAQALRLSAADLRGAVDSVIRPTQQLAVKREKTMDVAASCKLGSPGVWPRRWGYGVRVIISQNHLTVANNALRTLRAEGWKIQENASTEGVVDMDARRGDLVLHVVGEPTPSSLLVEGYGACIQEDGTSVPA